MTSILILPACRNNLPPEETGPPAEIVQINDEESEPSDSVPFLETETLTKIMQINEDGFGSSGNLYAWSMAVLGDSGLYVGTNNFSLNQPESSGDGSPASGWKGCEIWRYNGAVWDRVVEKGLGNPSNLGVRALKEINGCLYGATLNISTGMEIWRSCDGTNWEALVDDGFGSIFNYAARAITFFKGYIYVGVTNLFEGTQIWRSTDGLQWDLVEEAHPSDPGNQWFSNFAEFNGWLYLGTSNPQGMQLYRTDDGSNYERIFEAGLGLPANTHAMTLYTFNNKLFVGTMNRAHGCYLYVSEDGINFEPRIKNGLASPKNSYIWSLQEYNGRIYAGTFYEANLFFGNFHLYSSADGDEWIIENTNALGFPQHYGIRTMAVFNDKLIMGTAAALSGCKVIEAAAK